MNISMKSDKSEDIITDHFIISGSPWTLTRAMIAYVSHKFLETELITW